MKIAAHRGISSLAPENTLAAFQKAGELGCEWIEFDVQLTRDAIPVVIHDKTVKRCTNGTGIVSEMSLAELKLLDAGSWFSDAFCDEKIPTLEEVLLLAKQYHMSVNIELKIYPEDNITLLCDQINKAIINSNFSASSILFSSFDIAAMKYMYTTQPNIRRGQLWEEIPDDALHYLTDIEAYSVHCDHRYLKQEQAEWIKQNNYKICCYTANNPEEVNAHREWGVDLVFSDMPQAYTR